MITQRFGRFILSGMLATVLHVLIASSLIELLGFSPPAANGCAFATATIASYLINTLWSFSSRLHGRTALRFGITSVAGLLLSVSISATAEFLHWHYLYGIAAVVCLVPPVTFLLHHFWTYR